MFDDKSHSPQIDDHSKVFSISRECFGLGLRAGALVFTGVRVDSPPDELRELIAREIAQMPAGSAAPSQMPPPIAAQQAILRAVGVSPRKSPPASQRLLQLALRRSPFPAISNVVDCYNLVSLRTQCCLGAHDLAVLSLPITLRLLRGDEAFTPLGHTEAEAPIAGEFAYVDAVDRVICRLDVVQAEFSKVRETTTDVVVIVEATETHGAGVLAAAANEVSALIERYCGGTVVCRQLAPDPGELSAKSVQNSQQESP